MINKIIDFSFNNKFIIGLFIVVLFGTGIWSMIKVPVDAQPDITNNQVQVMTQAPNLGTEDIEQFVTYPVEIAMSNLPGVNEIRSVSRFGLSVVTIVFEDDMGTYLPRQLVGEKLDQVKNEIPDGFGQPAMGPISTGLGEIYQYTLEVDKDFKDQYTPTELRSIQDWIVRRQMAMVPGVVEVNGVGGHIKQYEVAIDPDELRAIGLDVSDVFAALNTNNQNTGGAYIAKNHQANFIRGEGLARNIEDLENIVVANTNGIPITVDDIAEVRIGSAVRYGALTKNGEGEVVGGMVMMLKGANSNEVIENVKNRIDQIQKSLPEGIRIKPFLDRSELIEDTTSTIKGNLLEGGLIVIFVLVLFLGNWRGGLIVASTIPLSLLFAFVMMHIFGVWANLMSLGAIDFGIIVDGAVIIVESTVFILHQKMLNDKKIDQAEKDRIASSSAKKMMNSAFFGQLIILIVFLPILALEGVEGKMFKPMALTFIFAMLGAMILCLTYVPMISSLFLRKAKKHKNSWGDHVVFWLQKKYEPLLKKSLEKGKLVLCLAILLLGIAAFMFSRMGGEFIPQLDEGDIAFHVILQPGSSLEEGIQTSTKIESLLLKKFPEIEQVVTRFGVSDVPTDPMPMDIGDSFIILKERSDWISATTKDELIAKIKEEISIFPGVSYEFTQPVEMRFNELLTGVREDIAVKLYGDDLDMLASKAQEMGKLIGNIEGVADMKVEATAGLPQITVNYNRSKIAQYGLQIEALNSLIQSSFAGGKAGVIFEGERRYDLVVRLQPEQRTSIENIQNLYVTLSSGAQVPLKEVANISYQSGPMQISRDNTNRRTYVGVNIRNRDVKSVVEDIQDKLDAELNLPAGYYIRYGGAFENFQRARKRLQIVVPIALLLIFILIYFALKSFKQSSMIYMAIPLAAIGGVYSLWLRDMPFSISAGVGFIVLFGVAVLNGLVLISGFNELKEEGVTNINERIAQGTKRRIRPILLTALTDVLGFLPMAISSSAGAEVQRPLATVVIGGLVTSTFLTLFMLPILYRWSEIKKTKGLINKNILTGLTVFAGVVLSINTVEAQENLEKAQIIDKDEAVEIALENYPLLKNEKRKLEQAEAMKGAAWDLGRTTIFTGGEELNNDRGIYTLVGFQQQQIDLLGIPSKNKFYRKRIELASNSYDLSALDVSREVKKSWSKAVSAKRKLKLYMKLDSLYNQLDKAVSLRYETEAISKLELLAAKNRIQEIAIMRDQALYDNEIAVQQLNLWLGNGNYTVPETIELGLVPDKNFLHELRKHPLLDVSESKMEVSDAKLRAERADFLPSFNIQYGIQEVNGNDGFYSYQAGISIPVFSGREHAEAKSAKIERAIAEEEFQFRKDQLKSEYRMAINQYKKWKSSWNFYRNQVVPLLEEQRRGTLLAFNEGAIDYVEMIQNLDSAVQSELKAVESYNKYQYALAEIEYYLNNK
ncbi:CusA/CzcA family heavy metal efflux RND transporter [Zunongwangia sp. SCSIO 43204]|uniref:CusA/CzcA family heavy metal efflux RND transporter n=1 Tax=Zunongwangia sp. SCSIO 43204 TaxID=2779359 RepID=UPI001CA8F303|nr:CusA/CzcA family heavy metal efflux RND transporter [Zunongwangia sp. SCSIO 43204]UAB85046.1 CusA/CzcA family heavy metal efflux RND transporter [Zunongwangia sp. SCSIO 43204]|tara:strand:- start:26212 stop:30552 length:4341 start_codon:yes stop_codon:yes gene_type:complete